MKKISTLLLAAVATFACANAETSISYQWSHAVDGQVAAMDNVVAAVSDELGSAYVITSFGSNSSSPNVYFDGATIIGTDGYAIEGSTGSSNNNNILIQKVDIATGEVAWFGYTCKGYVEPSYVSLAVTSDGGAVVAVDTRTFVATDGYDNLLEYVDATGRVSTIKDMWAAKQEYRFLLLKLTADGELDWTRLIAGDPQIDDDTTLNQNFYVNSIVVDGDDNIYVAGNFRSTLNFKNSDGTVTTLTAVNNTDPTLTYYGDLYLAKLDSDGYYSASLVADGTASYEVIDNLAYNNGKIYFNGRVMGDGSSITIGETSITAGSDFRHTIVGSVNTSDLSVNYVNLITSVANSSSKFDAQNKNAQYIDGTVYFTGSVNGGLASADGTTVYFETGATQLRGYVLAIDAESGDVKGASYNSTTGISNYFGVYVTDSSVLAHGYNMSTPAAILDEYSTDDYSLTNSISICTYGTVALCGRPCIYGDYFLMMNRGGKNGSTVTASFYDTEDTFDLYSWSAVYYCYKIGDDDSGVSSVALDNNISTNQNVYSTNGILIKESDNFSDAKAGLANGVYVIGNQKVLINE